MNAEKRADGINRITADFVNYERRQMSLKRERVKYSFVCLACFVVEKNVRELREISKIPIHRESIIN
jgi:hypothetical protein